MQTDRRRTDRWIVLRPVEGQASFVAIRDTWMVARIDARIDAPACLSLKRSLRLSQSCRVVVDRKRESKRAPRLSRGQIGRRGGRRGWRRAERESHKRSKKSALCCRRCHKQIQLAFDPSHTLLFFILFALFSLPFSLLSFLPCLCSTLPIAPPPCWL